MCCQGLAVASPLGTIWLRVVRSAIIRRETELRRSRPCTCCVDPEGSRYMSIGKSCDISAVLMRHGGSISSTSLTTVSDGRERPCLKRGSYEYNGFGDRKSWNSRASDYRRC